MTAAKHVRSVRIALRGLFAAAAVCVLPLSASAYVFPAPPPGFGGGAGGWTYTPPTPAEQVGKIMRGPGPSVAGSGPTTAAYRLAPGVGRALAKAVIGGGVATIAIAGAAWFLENCFKKEGGQWVRVCGGTPVPQSDGYQYRMFNSPGNAWLPWVNTRDQACKDYIAAIAPYQTPYTLTFVSTSGTNDTNQTCTFTRKTNATGETVTASGGMSRQASAACPVGWYVTPAGCVQQKPLETVTPQQVEDEMATKPLPQQLPPGFPYPLDPVAPSIWNPDLANPPNAQPMRVPMGNPTPVPNTDPQQYRQPMTRVTHSPTSAEPWRMDVQPEDVVSTDPVGQTGPETITGGSPPGEAKEKEPDLCEKNPDILACSKPELDTPEGDIPREDKNVSFSEQNLFGSGQCPADVSMSFVALGGKTAKIVDWQKFCNWALPLRALVLALAGLTAAMILMPGGVRE